MEVRSMRVVPSITGAAGMSWVTAIAIIVLLIAVGIAYTWIVTPTVHRHETRAGGEIHEEPEPRPLLRRVA
jgi:hypothetical protein